MDSEKVLALSVVIELSFLEGYKNLNIPIEIFHGTSDKIVPLELHAKNFHEKVFSSKLTELKGIGHMPHHFRKNIILQSIVSLLVKK